MQVANIIVSKDGVVHTNIGLIATEQGIITQGHYAGKSLSDTLEKLFYKECRKLDPTLPEACPNEESVEDLPDNYPNFDDGYYFNPDQTMSVCMTWATLL